MKQRGGRDGSRTRGYILCFGALTLWCTLAQASWAQDTPPQDTSPLAEVGRFFLESFSPEDYGAHAQNWDLEQDGQGLLYVANGAGVLQYDGASWRLIPTANRSVARSLALDSEGRIFVGAVAEIGYLAPTLEGQLEYVSLLDFVPEDDRGFSDVWQTHALPDGVYFQSEERLFRWHEGRLDVWRPETKFFRAFTLRDVLYVADRTGEVFSLTQGTLQLAAGGATFSDKRVIAWLPMGPEAFLAVTKDHGLFLCDNPSGDVEACSPFGSDEVRERLVAARPYNAVALPGGLLAIGTHRGGVLLIDQKARWIRSLDEASGLKTLAVWCSYVDRQGGLWLGLNEGLARVAVTPELSYFDKTMGLPETVLYTTRHRGQLYAATSRGVAVLNPKSVGEPHFTPVPGIEGFCWSLVSTEKGLLAGCVEGVYHVDRQERILELARNTAYSVHRSRQNPNWLYIGARDGLLRIRLDTESWGPIERFETVQEQIRTIAEDSEGRLWLGTRAEGVLRLAADASPSDAGAVRRFGTGEGLPLGWLETSTVDNEVRVMVDEGGGLFRFDTRADRFVPDHALMPKDSQGILELTEDIRGHVWTVAGADSAVVTPTSSGRPIRSPTASRRLPNLQPIEIIAEPGGVVWIPSAQGLIRLHAESSVDAEAPNPVWLRRVSASDGSILHDAPHGDSDRLAAWPHTQSALRFTFAAPFFEAPDHTRYRTLLEGFDDDWSAWKPETYRDFTNLWEGNYTFRVQARDVSGRMSREDTFTFRILPPWYRSWWAYGLYASMFAGSILATTRLLREKLRREQAINTRLREVDKLKDEFLANTSHELRTPIFGITGLAESLISGTAGDLPQAAQKNLEMIASSGRRLGRLINDVLDHSRLDHGSLRLHREPVDLHVLAETVLGLQAPLIQNKALELRNSVPGDLPAAYADEARVEQILHNLVSNAVKFTAQGHVEISAATSGQSIEISVEDTGIGIASSQRERIFQAFEQSDSGIQRAFGGTGLGLSVTRRLVELHGGAITVDSMLGEGACFTFSLPLSHEPAHPGKSVSRTSTTHPAAGSRKALAITPTILSEDSATADHRTVEPVTPRSPNQPTKAQILVVDDEPVNRLVLEQYLRLEGYGVDLAQGGAEALRLLDEKHFDLILLDVMMPEMSGFEVCQKLRSRHSINELPILFLTAKSQVDALVEGFDAGGNDYLPKPVDQTELVARVRTHLELLSNHRQLVTRHAELLELAKGSRSTESPSSSIKATKYTKGRLP